MGRPHSGALTPTLQSTFPALAIADKHLPTGKCLEGPRAVCRLPEDLSAIVGYTKTGAHCHLVGRAVRPSLCLPGASPRSKAAALGSTRAATWRPLWKEQEFRGQQDLGLLPTSWTSLLICPVLIPPSNSGPNSDRMAARNKCGHKQYYLSRAMPPKKAVVYLEMGFCRCGQLRWGCTGERCA